MKRLLARLVRQSPAMVVAMIALFVALTGTAVATTSALITGKQIKNGSLTGLDIKNKSVTSADVKGQLRGARGSRGSTGPQGLSGPQGIQGPTGPAGAPNPNAVNAENAEKLDGLDSTDFVRGSGAAVVRSFRADVPWNNATIDLAAFPEFGTLKGYCDATGEVGHIRFQNISGVALDAFYDNGAANPAQAVVASGSTYDFGVLAEPDQVTLQISNPFDTDRRVLTAIISAYDPTMLPEAAECRMTGVAIFQTGQFG